MSLLTGINKIGKDLMAFPMHLQTTIIMRFNEQNMAEAIVLLNQHSNLLSFFDCVVTMGEAETIINYANDCLQTGFEIVHLDKPPMLMSFNLSSREKDIDNLSYGYGK